MKRFIIFITIFFFLFSCKKEIENTSETKQDELVQPVNLSSSDVNNLIVKMNGDVPKEKVKFVDVEFTNLKSQSKKLSDYNGKVILLNLWATWCPPCRAEMPSMENLYKRYQGKDFVILAVSVGETQQTVQNFVKNKNFTFPIFVDDKNQATSAYSTGSIPTTYLIDQEGYLIARFVGGRDWDGEEIHQLINQLL
ncbi:MAG: TlpA family protein disulfide reductase [Spirochaetes bacterium]|nr:TlpA family protein disulfide reductase [Spirochaetota bacterium]